MFTESTPLTAISPVDGRYRRATAPLAEYFSEAARDAIGFEHMLGASARIGDVGGGDLVGAQVETVGGDDAVHFAPRGGPNLDQVVIDSMVLGNDERTPERRVALVESARDRNRAMIATRRSGNSGMGFPANILRRHFFQIWVFEVENQNASVLIPFGVLEYLQKLNLHHY